MREKLSNSPAARAVKRNLGIDFQFRQINPGTKRRKLKYKLRFPDPSLRINGLSKERTEQWETEATEETRAARKIRTRVRTGDQEKGTAS
jgi:hypothetical protein